MKRQVNPFDVAGLAAEKEQLEERMGAADFWDDVEAANKANQRMKVLSAKIEKYQKLQSAIEDAEVMADMAEEEDDQAVRKAREWDDWKDTHPRGYGNRQNMG